MNIKAIIMDLDRTLLHTDKSVSEYTLDVLERCRSKGISILIATARPLRDVTGYIELLKAAAVTVMNGAKVLSDGRTESYSLDCGDAENLLTEICKLGVPFSVEMGNDVYSNVPIHDYKAVIHAEFPKLPDGEAPYKIIVNTVEKDILESVKKMIPENMYFTIANNRMIQIMSKQATKWNGVKTMLDACGIESTETAYFGDDYDDIAPVKYCGIGVAVSNAIEEVKQAADYITLSNDEDGVAVFIEKHIL